MSLLGHSFFKLSQIFARFGVRGAFSFIFWKFRTHFEKTVIRFEDRWHLLSYEKWISIHEKPAQREIKDNSRTPSPFASFLIDTRNINENAIKKLENTLNSIRKQNITDWECVLIGGTETEINRLNSRTVLISDDRVKIQKVGMDSDRDSAIRVMLPILSGNWVIWTRPGDTFSETLLDFLRPLNSEIVYWDEDLLDHNERCQPFLKPDWSPELWLSIDLLYTSAVRLDFLKQVALMKERNSIISLYVAQAEHITHIPAILSHCLSHAWADQRGVQEHESTIKGYLAHRGIPDSEIEPRNDGSFRVSWSIHSEKISIIILNKDNYTILRQCIESILQKTTYENYELVIVDDFSAQESVINYYRSLQDAGITVKVVQGIKPFNYSQACNVGAMSADGDYLLFLNNDTEIINPAWLQELIMFAGINEIGIVGGKLLYPDRRIQHAGIIMGLEGHASHVFLGSFDNDQSPFGFVNWYRNYSAVTGACMMMRKQVFEEVGGFDEKFKLVFSDIELCLRVINAGYRVMYNPEVCLFHYEGKSRGKFIPGQDISLGYEKFVNNISEGDPFYNSSLSLAWRIPTLKRTWEQSPVERLRKIVLYS